MPMDLAAAAARAETITLTDIRSFITSAAWKFASTMPENPHWYTVRGLTPEMEFEAFVLYVRAHGYTAEFGLNRYVYFDIDGYSYWTMGAPLEMTTIINRKRADGTLS